MSSPQLAALWQSIERSGALDAAAIRFLDTGVRFPTGPVLAGLDGLNQRHLCIPANAGDLGREDKRSRGVTIEVRPLLGPDGQNAAFVDVHCRKPELNGLFEILAADILAESLKNPASPFSTAHTALERWRELLEPAEGAPLGARQLAALLAELLFLENLGRPGVPPVQFWLGPDKGPHDFVCGEVDFEVKSTLSTNRREVEVNGLTQLTEMAGTTLYLWWVRLRASPGRGVSVPDIIDRLIDSGADKSSLLKKLSLEGYAHSDTTNYRDIAFEVVESDLYRIDSEFPRLTTSSFFGGLPPQVTRVDYTINLSSATPVPLARAVAESLIDSVVGRK